MFYGATNFNQELNWNTSNVNNMAGMFYGASNFNQKLNWNTFNVNDMSFITKTLFLLYVIYVFYCT